MEWEEVYQDTFYGTLNSEVERIWSEGNHVIFDVDVKGGIKLKNILGDRALSVFVKVPHPDILRQRLQNRKTEDDASLKMRVDKAILEMKEESNFDKVVVNDVLDEAIKEAETLVKEFIKS